ncbi:unnamed protein product [Peniophora sp. CBMAI 1063]|nr:unnamed protein product [Peniophora sp. CBMAI 1063]
MPSQVAVERELEPQVFYAPPPQVAASYRAPSMPYSYASPHDQGYGMYWSSHDPASQPPIPVQAPHPAQPVAHKVWLLDCRTCGNFLTNRGMKAVLLLRPHVPLYSTDALPVNCSAHGSIAQYTPNASSAQEELPRTCDCLTQTLCCHGCGNGVGYMIVIPCSRCTSSVAGNNRATNGHRFVFHSAEITAHERHYIPHEPGVLPQYAPRPRTSTPPVDQPGPRVIESQIDTSMPLRSFLSTGSLSSIGTGPGNSPDPASPYADEELPASPTMPGLIAVSPSPEQRASSHRRGFPLESHPLYHAYPHSQPLPPHAQYYVSQGMPLAEEPPKTVRSLKPGALLYWHHLTRAGEIPGVRDDPRARAKRMVAYDR